MISEWYCKEKLDTSHSVEGIYYISLEKSKISSMRRKSIALNIIKCKILLHRGCCTKVAMHPL